MSVNTILLTYQARLVELHATASHLRLGQVIAFGVMSLAVLAIIVLAFLSIAKPRVSLPWVFAPVPVALYSGIMGKRRNSSLLRTVRVTSYYERGLDRLSGHWAGSGNDGEEFLRLDHSYAKDLNVFGKGSLFELLCTCRTEVGRRWLADYLLGPPTVGEANRRQQAIAELRDQVQLREEIEALGQYSFQQSSWETITDWLDTPLHSVQSSLRFATLMTSTLLGAIAFLGWDGTINWITAIPYIAGLLVSHAFVGSVFRRRLAASSGNDMDTVNESLPLLKTCAVKTLRASAPKLDGPALG